MPSSLARSTNNECSVLRRTPYPVPWEILALAEDSWSEKEIPRNGYPWDESNLTPSVAKFSTAPGSNPSPQAFAIGGFLQSTTSTQSPLRVAAIAVAIPAGPAP